MRADDQFDRPEWQLPLAIEKRLPNAGERTCPRPSARPAATIHRPCDGTALEIDSRSAQSLWQLRKVFPARFARSTLLFLKTLQASVNRLAHAT
jgi:hypothetical protein